MPRVDLPHTEVTLDGVAAGAEVSGDASNNHSTANDGNVFLIVRNSGAGNRTVTLVTPGTVGGQAIADKVITLAAAATRYVRIGDPSVWGSPAQIDVEHAEVKLTAYHLAN